MFSPAISFPSPAGAALVPPAPPAVLHFPAVHRRPPCLGCSGHRLLLRLRCCGPVYRLLRLRCCRCVCCCLLLRLSCRGIGFRKRDLRYGSACWLLGGHTARQPTASMAHQWICRQCSTEVVSYLTKVSWQAAHRPRWQATPPERPLGTAAAPAAASRSRATTARGQPMPDPSCFESIRRRGGRIEARPQKRKGRRAGYCRSA